MELMDVKLNNKIPLRMPKGSDILSGGITALKEARSTNAKLKKGDKNGLPLSQDRQKQKTLVTEGAESSNQVPVATQDELLVTFFDKRFVDQHKRSITGDSEQDGDENVVTLTDAPELNLNKSNDTSIDRRERSGPVVMDGMTNPRNSVKSEVKQKSISQSRSNKKVKTPFHEKPQKMSE